MALVGCSSAATPSAVPTLAPEDVIKTAAENVRGVKSLKMTIERSGAAYAFESEMGTVTFNRMEGQYVAPDTIQAKARVLVGKLPIDLDVFAKGVNQWMRGIFSNNEWQKGDFATSFNPQALISQENSGFQLAMGALQDLKLAGEEQLEDGTPVDHYTSTAAGEDVAGLIAGLIQMEGQVNIDVYIDKAKQLPVKFVIVQPDTGQDSPDGPTTWTIEIYDFDVQAELEPPADA